MNHELSSESLVSTNSGAGKSRFNHHLKTNLVRIHKNLYLNPSDPLYYEKILRYADSGSPEAHYKLAQKFEQGGSYSKALFHYQQAARSLSSPYYIKAKQAARRLENHSGVSQSAKEASYTNLPQRRTKIPMFAKSVLICLFLFNVLLLILLWNIDTARTVVSAVRHWTVGTEVVYETMDVPYVIYLPHDDNVNKIQKTLYNKAVDMGGDKPNHNIQLFGIITSDPKLFGKTVPLSNDKLKEASFVKAEYNPAIDRSVKIRFQNKELRKQNNSPLSETTAAANLVRTALEAYIDEKGNPPHSIEALIRDYPNNYLSFIPIEVQSGSNHVATKFDGAGGWVYHSNAKRLSDMFYPNIADEQTALQIPYEPIQIVISKNNYTLQIISGSSVLASKPVGLGKNNQTPEDVFTIQDRVLRPVGQHPKVYGEAGLGMGQYAIHGTYNDKSIQANESLGCVRLSNRDMLDIFPLTPKGASVHIAAELPSANQHASVIVSDSFFPSLKPRINQTPQNITFSWLG